MGTISPGNNRHMEPIPLSGYRAVSFGMSTFLFGMVWFFFEYTLFYKGKMKKGKGVGEREGEEKEGWGGVDDGGGNR